MFNLKFCNNRSENGADRVELCRGGEVGGTTPDLEALKSCSVDVDLE
jgi:copper homeostasis protein CutC